MKAFIESDDDEILGKAYDGRIMRRLLPYLRPYRKNLVVALVLLLGTGLLDLAGPWLTKVAIDRYIVPHHPSGLKLIFALYIGALVFGFLMRYGENYFMQYVGQRVMYDLRNEIFAHIQRYLDHLAAQGNSPAQIRSAMFQYGPTAGQIRELIASSLLEDENVRVPAESIVPTLDEGLERLQALIQKGAHHPQLVTGPSRTADIERVLTIGVHGPRELSILILENGASA